MAYCGVPTSPRDLEAPEIWDRVSGSQNSRQLWPGPVFVSRPARRTAGDEALAKDRPKGSQLTNAMPGRLFRVVPSD